MFRATHLEVREKSWQTRIKRGATLKQPQLNVADRNTTSSDRKSPADALASRFATDTVYVLLRSVTYCHISLRLFRFIRSKK